MGKCVFVTTEAFWLGDEVRRGGQWSYRVWLLCREELELELLPLLLELQLLLVTS